MQGFPGEADEAAVLLLMSVVRADQKVLKEELDSIRSFFSEELQVSQERLHSIQEQMARYAHEAIPEEKFRNALERLPESALRHVVIGGASGLIGRALAERLRADGIRVTTLVRTADAGAARSLPASGPSRRRPPARRGRRRAAHRSNIRCRCGCR